eukprot:4769887-Pleurochrysis_carterae.AAC.1
MRGCGPSPAWCACGRPEQHRLPWDFDESPPTSFNELRQRSRRVCAGCLTHSTILSLAHAAPAVFSGRCNKVQYPTQELWATARAELERLQKSKSKQKQAAYAEQRRRHAASHSGQHEFRTPVFCFDMADAIPELLHADSLNVAKLLFKYAIFRHADPRCRERLAVFFSGLRYPIDLRKKEDGRSRNQKWWRASAWDAL